MIPFSPLKSKHHHNKYLHWTEAPEEAIYRDLPANAAQHDFLRHHGVKHKKHLNTHYMSDKTLLGRLANSIQTNWIKGKHVIGKGRHFFGRAVLRQKIKCQKTIFVKINI